jgi:hypothetical protein
MAGAASISRLAAENAVSRKFVYQQKDKAKNALDEAFTQTADDGILFSLLVTKESYFPHVGRSI